MCLMHFFWNGLYVNSSILFSSLHYFQLCLIKYLMHTLRFKNVSSFSFLILVVLFIFQLFLFFFFLFIFLTIFLNFIFTLFYFTLLYWFCHTLTWIRHGCTWVPKHEPRSHLPLCLPLDRHLVVFSFGLWWIKLQWAFDSNCLYGHVFISFG